MGGRPGGYRSSGRCMSSEQLQALQPTGRASRGQRPSLVVKHLRARSAGCARGRFVMRLIAAFILCVGFVVGCGRSSQLTPEQKQQVDAARSATVAASERLLGRALTDSERECIHIDFKEGQPVGSVSAPLSETLKKRQAELLEPSTKPN